MRHNSQCPGFVCLMLMIGCEGDPAEPSSVGETVVDATVGLETAATDLGDPDVPEVVVGDDGPGPSDCEPGTGCFLDPCNDHDACTSGWCIHHLGDQVCTTTCVSDCPDDFSCKSVTGAGSDVTWVCLSNATHLCRPCVDIVDCGSPTGAEDVCVDYGEQGFFCGAPCANDADCAEATTTDGTPSRQCVAPDGVCECSAKATALSFATTCAMANDAGVCPGTRFCSVDGLTACDAPVLAPDVCDGKDTETRPPSVRGGHTITPG